MPTVVARYINGISLNGYEYLLTEDKSQTMQFPDETSAKEFMMKNGYTEEQCEDIIFLEET